MPIILLPLCLRPAAAASFGLLFGGRGQLLKTVACRSHVRSGVSISRMSASTAELSSFDFIVDTSCKIPDEDF